MSQPLIAIHSRAMIETGSKYACDHSRKLKKKSCYRMTKRVIGREVEYYKPITWFSEAEKYTEFFL